MPNVALPNTKVIMGLILTNHNDFDTSKNIFIIKLRLCDIVKDGDRYRLEITEQKTQKKRVFIKLFYGYRIEYYGCILVENAF